MLQQPIQQSQGQPPSPQMAPTTIMVPVQTTGKYESLASVSLQWLGALLIIFGVVMIILNGVDIGLFASIGIFGQGILAGIFYILVGSFACGSGKYKTACPIIAMLVLAIIASLAAISATAMHAIGVVFPWNGSAGRGVNSTIVFLAFVGGIFCIVCSALACAALCRGRSYQQGAVVIMPMNNTGQTSGQPQQYTYQPAPQQYQGNPPIPQVYGQQPSDQPPMADAPPPYSKTEQTSF